MASPGAEWIASLRLEPHPEGGFYRETYRAQEAIEAAHLPARFGGTVAPGFDFADFELADRASLLAQFPQHRETIIRLTR